MLKHGQRPDFFLRVLIGRLHVSKSKSLWTTDFFQCLFIQTKPKKCTACVTLCRLNRRRYSLSFCFAVRPSKKSGKKWK